VETKEIGMCKDATKKYMLQMRASYSILWQPNLTDGKFSVAEDFTTEERRRALRAVRKDDKTFATESRIYRPNVDGKGPIATAWRTGQQVRLLDTSGMLRAKLAEEFGIKKILFQPVSNGVLEVGTPSDETMLYFDLLKASVEELKSKQRPKRTFWVLLKDVVLTVRMLVLAAATSVNLMQGLRLTMSDFYYQGLEVRNKMTKDISARPLRQIGRIMPLFLLTVAMSLVTPIVAMTTVTERYYAIKGVVKKRTSDNVEDLGSPGQVLAIRVFEKLDVDGDGYLTADEWDRAFGRKSNFYPPLRPFSELTKNTDVITRDEFVKLTGDSMLSGRIAKVVGV
jgi:hypothetical protein